MKFFLLINDLLLDSVSLHVCLCECVYVLMFFFFFFTNKYCLNRKQTATIIIFCLENVVSTYLSNYR